MMNHDLYQETTNRIVEAIESGVTPPWVKPWSLAEMQPRNAVTKRVYRGINNLLLVLAANARGYQQSRWLTFHQAAELGGHVRSGEHGVRVVFYKQHTFTEAGAETGDVRSFPVLRCFTVFNVAQVGGLPDTCFDAPRPATWNGHFIADAVLSAAGADIRHDGSHAYYNGPTDIIHIPPRYAFADQGSYYATALHELTHWSGHPRRCNRDLRGRFGDDSYAMEELVAELGSSFLCAHCKIDGRLQHAAYVSSWLRVLKNDKRAIFTAATKAQQAVDYVLSATQCVKNVEAA